MVDHQNSVDPSASPGEAGAPSGSKLGFLNTTTGKVVVGGVAVLLVLGAIGAAVFFFLLGGAVDDAVQQATNSQSTSSTAGSNPETMTPTAPEERSLASTFTFRNIFAPTMKMTFESSATADASTATSTADAAVNVPSDTLFLQDVVSENGQPMAMFIWNGQTYTVGEGDQVSTSPWKVLQINSDSVLMLYGDSQVTLSIGQGVGK